MLWVWASGQARHSAGAEPEKGSATSPVDTASASLPESLDLGHPAEERMIQRSVSKPRAFRLCRTHAWRGWELAEEALSVIHEHEPCLRTGRPTLVASLPMPSSCVGGPTSTSSWMRLVRKMARARQSTKEPLELRSRQATSGSKPTQELCTPAG